MDDDAPDFAREPAPGRLRWLTALFWGMGHGGPPEPGLYLRTKRGTTYLVREVKRCRPDSQARYRLGVFRVAPESVPDGAKVGDWWWAGRAPGRR